jgi:hypothetical protein
VNTVQVFGPSSPPVPVYAEGPCRSSEPVHGRVATPFGFPISRVECVLAAGVALRWDGTQGDDVVYVAHGSLRCGGRVVDARGALIVEAGCELTVAAAGDAHVVHFVAVPPDGPLPSASGGGSHHVVGPDGVAVLEREPEPGTRMTTRFFADSTCPSCAVTFLRVEGSGPYRSRSHAHSQPELLHVTLGAIKVGATVAPAGTTVAIPADRRYSFRSEGDWEFVNVRGAPSTITYGAGETLAETVDGLGCRLVGA